MMNAIEALESVALSVPWPLLWLGACLGHAFLMTVGLNALYAWPLPRAVLKLTRKLDILIILAAPLIFFFALDVLGSRQLSWREPGVRRLLAPYALACFFVGFGIAPLCQLRYWLRKTAPQQTSVLGEIVDVAQVLGFAPKGHGRDARLCGLPGNQCFQVEFNEKTFTLPQLPAAWDGLSILHLTDLHFCGTPDRTFHRFVVDRALRDGPPDLIAITGDVVDSGWHHRWIAPILGRLRYREFAWAILGNHDYYRDVTVIRRRLRKMGLRVLANQWEKVTLRGEPLVVIGNESPWLRPLPDLTGCPEGIFRLGLCHTPDAIRWAQRRHIDLVLAGHVHGGQIRFPLIGSTFCPSRFSRRFDCGTFFEAPTVMHVSRGLAGQHPLRFNCRPEVTKIILRKATG
jgi:predicted MPP superfamily phosphohydrolase